MAAKREPLAHLLLIEDPSVEKAICGRIASYTGQGAQLASALGALVLGQHYGTRVLRMVHSPSTYRKYERILGIRFEDLCPETTDLSEKNAGFAFARKIGAFWDVVMGRNKIEKKGWIDGEEEAGR